MIIQFVIFVDETKERREREIIVEYFDNLKNNRTNPYRRELWNRLLLLPLQASKRRKLESLGGSRASHTRALRRIRVDNLLAFQSVRAKKSRFKNNIRSAVNGETAATIVGKKFITEVSIDSSKSPIDGSEDKAKNFGEAKIGREKVRNEKSKWSTTPSKSTRNRNVRRPVWRAELLNDGRVEK